MGFLASRTTFGRQLGEVADLTAKKMKVAQMFNTPKQLHSSTSAAFLPNPCYMPCLSHGSLFSGIGGFELGAKEAGIETVWSCEYEQFNRDVLRKNFSNTKQYENIIDMEIPEYVDIISGGFPCQDISIANTNADGIKGKRSGLWSEMFRIIRGVRPKYVIIENSPMLLVRGFERVLCDLSEIGYDAEWQSLSAETFGYPHKRERLYCIADRLAFASHSKTFDIGFYITVSFDLIFASGYCCDFCFIQIIFINIFCINNSSAALYRCFHYVKRTI